MPSVQYVYSTLSADVAYTVFVPKTKEQLKEEKENKSAKTPQVIKKILIKGGANVALERKNVGLITFKGVATQVSDEEIEMLKKNKTFQEHYENGFISYSSAKEDPEKIAKEDHVASDNSAPMDEQKIKESQKKKDDIQQFEIVKNPDAAIYTPSH